MNNNRITQSIIVSTATLMSAIAWGVLEDFFYNQGFWLWPILSLLVLTVFLSLIWLLTTSKIVIYITQFFILVTFFFYFGFNWQYLLMVLAAMALFTFGSYLSIRERKLRLKIQIIPILKKGLPLVFTGLSLLIAGAYYFSPVAVQEGEQVKIPRPLFDTFSKPFITIFFNQFSEAQNNIDTLKTPKNRMNENLYNASNEYLNRVKRMYEKYIPLGLAVGVFIVIKGASIFFVWLTVLISLLIFKFLVWRGAITVQEQTALKEVIEV